MLNRKNAKLTQALVDRMRERYAAGEATQGDLAREHYMSVGQIGRVLRGESWPSGPRFGARSEELDASLQRLLLVQKEVDEKNAREKMAAAIAAAKPLDGDKLVDELTGDPNGRPAKAE